MIERSLTISLAFGSRRQVGVQIGFELRFLEGFLSWEKGLGGLHQTLSGQGGFPHGCELWLGSGLSKHLCELESVLLQQTIFHHVSELLAQVALDVRCAPASTSTSPLFKAH